MPTPRTASYLTLVFGAEDEGVARSDRCAGMPWTLAGRSAEPSSSPNSPGRRP
ncbi:MAG: hypothetical protein QOG89_1906, partial [Thermomicrobiales bacterium]|nr:hypothetical protein [Thermomicrobiales bacterium]